MTTETWAYSIPKIVPDITDEQIAEMRHIHPVMKEKELTCWYRHIKGAHKLHPRNVSCIWDMKPTGKRLAPHTLNEATIVTMHECSYFFKPSLAEVYAWIRFFMGDEWTRVKYFWINENQTIRLANMDVACQTTLLCDDMIYG